MYNGQVLYRRYVTKNSKSKTVGWLRYVNVKKKRAGSPQLPPFTFPLDGNFWMVSDTNDKGKEDAWAYSFEMGLHSPTEATKWWVVAGGEWEEQPVTCTQLSRQQQEEKNRMSRKSREEKKRKKDEMKEEKRTPPRVVTIAGATGNNADTVNGKYHPTDEMYNDRVLYRRYVTKHSKSKTVGWLRYVNTKKASNRELTNLDGSYWVVSDTNDKETNNANGYAYSDEIGLHSPTEATKWWVYNGQAPGGDWEEQPVTCTQLPQQQQEEKNRVSRKSREEKKREQDEMEEEERTIFMNYIAPHRVVTIAGATGSNADNVNGEYHPTDEIYNDRVLYRRYETNYSPDRWLRYVNTKDGNFWMVSNTNDKETNNANAWAYSVEVALHSPIEATKWWVYNGPVPGGEWEEQHVTCTQLSQQQQEEKNRMSR